jgi:hypothetical protein
MLQNSWIFEPGTSTVNAEIKRGEIGLVRNNTRLGRPPHFSLFPVFDVRRHTFIHLGMMHPAKLDGLRNQSPL